MPMHAEYMQLLECSPKVGGLLGAQQLHGRMRDFLARRWLVTDGYQTHLLVPICDGHEDVEVEIDKDAGVFHYRSPGSQSRVITRPLSEIALYVFNVDVWLDELTDAFGIEPSRRARKRTLVADHLWHLGDVRIARSHDFAPVYVARRLQDCTADWRSHLIDRVRPGQGIVLTVSEVAESLPNAHQGRALDELLLEGPDGVSLDTDALNRLLGGLPADAARLDEYFDGRTGELKLPHMEQAKIFDGIQKKVIALFWKERYKAGLKWADVKTLTRCGKDPDSVFGKGAWQNWLERVPGSRGFYRLRTARRAA